MKKLFVLVLVILSVINNSESQTPTLGLIQNDPGAFDGYTLFIPNTYSKTYLIDNCGNMVNSWQGSSQPGLSVYFLESGFLLRTARVNNAIFGTTGGSGGRIEMYDWLNNLIWAYNYSDSTHQQHHDIEYLANGNILVIAWEAKSASYVLDRGRSPSLVNSSLWLEHIIELEPIGSSAANIVWEWHVSDHLIQDIDSTKLNYGIVQNHPELINFNFASSANQDWLHINSIDYNPFLDQIILSAHNSGEIWIIDHSTSSTEAAGHTGGNSGKGGDLLYRWGNPRAYLRGGSVDQKLWGQHDAHWIEPGLNDAGKIMVFNNGMGRPGGNYSSVDVIQTPIDSSSNYTINASSAFGPDTLDWQYSGNPTSAFYSSNISGAQRLPNGNTLICEGSSGNFFEIDTNKLIVWNYINPVNQSGPLSQGANPVGNAVFRCTRFGPNYTGFTGQTLSAGLPVELNPYPSTCTLFTSTGNYNLDDKLAYIEIYPNPAFNELHITSFAETPVKIEILDLTGRPCRKLFSSEKNSTIPIQDLPAGVYIISIQCGKSNISKRIIKMNTP